MKDIIIIGGKGNAVVIAEQMEDARRRFGVEIRVKGFAFDDPAYSAGINGWPVLCPTREAYRLFKEDNNVFFVFAMYRSDLMAERIALRDSYGIPDDRYISFIHPSATVLKSVEIGNGVIILANSVINSNVRIGRHCYVLSNSVVEHDTIIGDNNIIAAHSCIGSGIKIGNGNFLGMNSTYRTPVMIGDNNIIGMGSVVLHNIADHGVYAGNPAGRLRDNKK